jgi:2-aminobenzoate-CoA ligase
VSTMRLEQTNRFAHALVEDLGIVPGNRVFIRSANNPAMVARWLAATKAGAVVVNTILMLRAAELAKYVELAEIKHALCDTLVAGRVGKLRECGRSMLRVVELRGF